MKLPLFLFLGLRGSIQQGRTRKIPQQLRGAILGIGLSIIPLLVVIVMTNGMIEGITRRLIEITTCHLQLSVRNASEERLAAIAEEIRHIDGVSVAFIERSGFALVRSKDDIGGVTLRAIPETLYSDDAGLREYLDVTEGRFDLGPVPCIINEDIVRRRVFKGIDPEKQRLFLSAYRFDDARGVYVLKEETDGPIPEKLARLFSALRFYPILLAQSLADTLHVSVGDQVFVLSHTDFHSNIVIKSTRCIVAGLVTTGYQDIDKVLAYVSESAGKLIFGEMQSEQYIGIKVDDPFSGLNRIMEDIDTIISNNKMSFSTIRSWYQMQENQYRSFSITKALLVFIMILIILVASVNVYSSIVMIVMEKTQEIAILKSMGVSPRTITFSFLAVGTLTGCIGTIVGLAVGLLIALNINEVIGGIEWIVNRFLAIYHIIISPFVSIDTAEAFVIFNTDFYLERIPINISIIEIFAVCFVTLLLSTLAAYRPAREAGRIKPLEVIRRY
ncbi:MAG: ABC transporter permease [Spirochaetales bacterium]|nr:ABC transporter permease [Spirochaetales bacterium]